MPSKQVLVMKKFPKSRNLRTGKYVAQGAHASLAPILSTGIISDNSLIIPLGNNFVREWLTSNFRKITTYVDTDEELIALYDKAIAMGVLTSLIKDSGLTEFNGVPTLTAVGIGPDNEEIINQITGHLPLF